MTVRNERILLQLLIKMKIYNFFFKKIKKKLILTILVKVEIDSEALLLL